MKFGPETFLNNLQRDFAGSNFVSMRRAKPAGHKTEKNAILV